MVKGPDGPRFVFVANGRRLHDVHERYPAEFSELYGPAAAEGLRFATCLTKANHEILNDDKTIVVVVGPEWREFLSRKPGWREVPDPERLIARWPLLKEMI